MHGARHEYLLRPCQSRDTCSDMDPNTCNVVTSSLDLPGVEACANRDAFPTETVAQRACTMHCTSGAVKGRKRAVTGVLHDATAKPRYDPTSLRIVTVEDVVPQMVTGLSGNSRRLDDVREEHRSQHPIDVGNSSRRTGEKFLHRIERRGPFSSVPPTMHFASKLDELCVPERRSHSAPTGNAHDRIVSAVYDERGR